MPVDRPRRRRNLIVATLAIGLLVGSVIVVAILQTPGDAGDSPSPGAEHQRPSRPLSAWSSGAAGPESWQELPALPQTRNPIRYARAVARALFTWDTMALTPDDYANPVIVDADPSGVETNGLLADLTGYLPNEQAWQQLREYRTTQYLEIRHAYVPASWARIAREAGDRIRPDTMAVTIEATRRRDGTWLGEPETSAHDVAFTVFLACTPTYDRCHTLRLSQLDNPLR